MAVRVCANCMTEKSRKNVCYIKQSIDYIPYIKTHMSLSSRLPEWLSGESV